MANLMDAPDVLKKIAAYKADEVKALKKRTNIKELRAYAAKLPAPKGFASALEKAAKTGPALIAEVKKASPSKGVIRADFQGFKAAMRYSVKCARPRRFHYYEKTSWLNPSR